MGICRDGTVYIIGSGLSSIAAAAALADRGVQPTILDVGLRPEAWASTLKRYLCTVEPEDWKREQISRLQFTGPTSANGIPRKLYFGSDFSFHQIRNAVPLDLQQASMYRSFAAGGFSNVWGAVVQPLPESEITGWPITWSEFAPHYAAVRRIVFDLPSTGSSQSPPDGEPDGQGINPSSQAQSLYSDLAAGREVLARQGIRFQYASLAIRSADRNGDKGCRYCGLCLYGCPYDCRYSATITLNRLIDEEKVRYVRGMVAEKLSHENGLVKLEVRSLAGGPPVVLSARRVLVGAGLLETTRIILASLGLYDTPLYVSHSDIFTLPVVRYRSAKSVFSERLHTLCQLVVEVEAADVSEHPVHLQFYGYNDLYLSLLRQKLGPLATLLNPALKGLASRLFLVFGYLHSSVSSSLRLTLRGNGYQKLFVEGLPNPKAGKTCQAIAHKILQYRKYFRAIPIPFQVNLDLPGGGYHSGGSFPMQSQPEMLQTDRLGRLASLPGVHLIDASVLPAVPSGTTAFTVMANAHRVASEIDLLHGL